MTFAFGDLTKAGHMLVSHVLLFLTWLLLIQVSVLHQFSANIGEENRRLSGSRTDTHTHQSQPDTSPFLSGRPISLACLKSPLGLLSPKGLKEFNGAPKGFFFLRLPFSSCAQTKRELKRAVVQTGISRVWLATPHSCSLPEHGDKMKGRPHMGSISLSGQGSVMLVICCCSGQWSKAQTAGPPHTPNMLAKATALLSCLWGSHCHPADNCTVLTK